ncbi:hypothetical protein [Algicella marina]|uniref:Uncharacterized protein n=1 Tax=Algicella marina TaxID=2683284 RepID=A0A6P1T101_9RHOB|nr:hypothetical protein [Algicella marina]QHQ34969.1 hypothetical protein GO499_07040 [Algicella marina]
MDRVARIDAALKADPQGTNPGALSQRHCEAASLQTSPEARRFHLTHAWIFALVAGDEVATASLESALREAGGL